MPPTAATISGYLLEEVLAYLLKSNGYRLLDNAADDGDALVDDPARGLLVRGRGTTHQVDVLGELMLPQPFSLPVRLFVEAKNRGGRSDVVDLRNAHGVIHDVNQHYSTEGSTRRARPLQRYQYRYVLFSTSGFTSHAQDFAMAHQLSLVDLSGPAFAGLRDAVTEGALAALDAVSKVWSGRFPVRDVRKALRVALGTASAPARSEWELPVDEPGRAALVQVLDEWAAATASRVQGVTADEGLLLAFPRAPFLLALQPDDMAAFEAHVAERDGSDITVDIRFTGNAQEAGDWVVTPRSGLPFRLRFGLPPALERWLLASPGKFVHRVDETRLQTLSDVSVFLEDRLVRLVYTPVDLADDDVVDVDADLALPGSREESVARRLLHGDGVGYQRPEVPGGPIDVSSKAVGWAPDTARRLLAGLVSPYRDLLLVAADTEHDGRLPRREVYLVADFPPVVHSGDSHAPSAASEATSSGRGCCRRKLRTRSKLATSAEFAPRTSSCRQTSSRRSAHSGEVIP